MGELERLLLQIKQLRKKARLVRVDKKEEAL
jgi:hypothetical protein